jgi:hypothetical protein
MAGTVGLGNRRRWRPSLLLLAGCLLGLALGGPGAALSRTIRPAAMQTRIFTCTGLSFKPLVSSQTYNFLGFMLYTSSTGFFVCNAALPNKAVVTKVEFTLRDFYSDEELRYCALVRSGMTPATVDHSDLLAELPTTGRTAAPGNVRLKTSAINFASVDNANFAYLLQCQFHYGSTAAAGDEVGPSGGNFTSAGIYGAVVTYKISAANG